MLGTRWRLSLIGLGCAFACIAGCKSFFGPRGIPNDPMLLSKQPIESKGQVVPERPLAHREPMPPRGNARSSTS